MVHISPSLLTTEEVADTLRIPLPTAHYLKKKGKIPNAKIGGRYRYNRSVVEGMLDIVRVQALGDTVRAKVESTLSQINRDEDANGGGIFILPKELPHTFAGFPQSKAPDAYIVESSNVDIVPKDFRGIVIEIVRENEEQQYPGSMLTRDEHLGQALLQARAAKQAQKEGLPR